MTEKAPIEPWDSKSNFLGEKIIPLSKTPYADYTPVDWAMEYVGRYGGIDGAHHKTWVLDQVARILKGTRVVVKVASWKFGAVNKIEWRFETGKPSKKYLKWVEAIKNVDGEEYDYDEGLAP